MRPKATSKSGNYKVSLTLSTARLSILSVFTRDINHGQPSLVGAEQPLTRDMWRHWYRSGSDREIGVRLSHRGLRTQPPAPSDAVPRPPARTASVLVNADVRQLNPGEPPH